MEKSLLSSLQNALNNLYDGNTVSSQEAKQDGVSHIDMYHCNNCGVNVKEDDFYHAGKLCVDCYLDKMADATFKYGDKQ